VYIDADGEERLRRRIQRDQLERGYGETEVRYQWEHHVRPAEALYLEPYKNECALLVDNSHSMEDGLARLITVINGYLRKP
jgi:uridine kinase